MFNMPEDIVNFFFTEIHNKGKYEIHIDGNSAQIIPRREEKYYKPIIEIKDIEELRLALYEYIECVTNFYTTYNIRHDYQDLSYFLNILLFSMTFSDSEDLTKHIYKRVCFFKNAEFNEYSERTLFLEVDDIKFYVERIVEEPGLETPFVLIFEVESEGVTYPLPLVRYAFDSNNVCHLFAVQFGRNREYDPNNAEYKKIVNKVNIGVNKFRNVSPSFVLSYALFLKLLNERGIEDIMVPGFLFARYKNYYKANTVKQSNILLHRIFDNFLLLLQRMEYEIDGFEIWSYVEDFDSYTHIKLKDLNSKNKLISRILTK